MTDLSDPVFWPGKRGKDPVPGEPECHPAAFHMLDVAAVADRLLALAPERTARLAAIAGADPAAFRRWAVFWVALHDLGKYQAAFAVKLLGDDAPDRLRSAVRGAGALHWQATFILLRLFEDRLRPVVGGSCDAYHALAASIAGHHADPPESVSNSALRSWRAEPAVPAARAFVDALIALLNPAPIPLDAATAKRLGWALTGLTVVADWIGSNRDWFPYAAPDGIDLPAYWERARERAARAVDCAGVSGAAPDVDRADPELLGLAELRPLQRAAATVPLPDGPALALLEDMTGAGKTEAAILLARRMMRAGKAGGLHFALPTMATANALFDRMAPIAGRLFQVPPSLALAHSRRQLHEGFRRPPAADGPPLTGEREAPVCADWIADDRRKTFLAELGVGTVDQALLAVLPSRFHALRLWGLADRVLVIDEAHSYDDYMNEELAALLRFQAALGGSAIVMSATLSAAIRRKLIAAFRQGLGEAGAETPTPGFPGLTVIGRGTAEARPIAPVPATCRTVPVERLDGGEAALAAVRDAARAGAAVAWVRNAVDEAVTAARRLAEEGLPVTLFHARFAMGDRLAIERDVVRRFGPSGTVEDRAGRILIATQVIEQSLDLDFDVMVSDLAPVDLLIQRAGRLWRHMARRPAAHRPVPEPVLRVLSPDPDRVEGADWLSRALGKGAWVYAADRQYLTARALFAAGAIRAPDALPALIEAVYGPEVAEIPAPLLAKAQRAEGERAAETAHGHSVVLDLAEGTMGNRRPSREEKIATRLGETMHTLVLARRTPAGLEPWAAAPDQPAEQRWALSELGLREDQFRRIEAGLPPQDAADLRAITKDWPEWRRATHRLVPVAADGGCGAGLRYDPAFGLLFADPSLADSS